MPFQRGPSDSGRVVHDTTLAFAGIQSTQMNASRSRNVAKGSHATDSGCMSCTGGISRHISKPKVVNTTAKLSSFPALPPLFLTRKASEVGSC